MPSGAALFVVGVVVLLSVDQELKSLLYGIKFSEDLCRSALNAVPVELLEYDSLESSLPEFAKSRLRLGR